MGGTTPNLAGMGMPQAPPAQESSLSYVGGAHGIFDLIGRFINIKEHQRQQAMNQFMSTAGLMAQGFPIKDTELTRLAKKAKLPFENDPDKLKAWAKSMSGEQAGGTEKGPPNMNMATGLPNLPPAPPGSDPHLQEAIDMHNRIASSGKPASGAEMYAMYVKGLAARASQMLNMQAKTEMQRAQNAQMVESLKGQVLQGGPLGQEARGKLMRAGELPINVPYEQWNAMTDQEKRGYLRGQAGYESDAEKSARGQRIGEALLTSGRFSDPRDAFAAGKSLAEGGSIAPELVGKMKPYSFAESTERLKWMGILEDMGVAPGDMGRTLQAVESGGFENAFPTGMKSLQMQELDIRSKQMDIEKLKYEKEVEIANKMDRMAAAKELSEQSKADLENFKALVELKKMGGNVPSDLLKGAQAKAAAAMNMDVHEVQSWWEGIFGGTHFEFTPSLTPGGKATVEKFTGGAQGAKTPETGMHKFLRGVGNLEMRMLEKGRGPL
jgi:hypothetical protein